MCRGRRPLREQNHSNNVSWVPNLRRELIEAFRGGHRAQMANCDRDDEIDLWGDLERDHPGVSQRRSSVSTVSHCRQEQGGGEAVL